MAALPVNILSLCAGSGALDAGLKLALPAARTICYVENEITAAGILAKGIANAWVDDAPIWSDLKTFDPKPWRGLVDGIIGGYPCQPFSTAGKRLGKDDPRHLWPFIQNIIQSTKPQFIFCENVEAHLKNGYFNIVRPSLERNGYAVAEGIFTATEVGAPFLGKRLFWLAYSTAYSVNGKEKFLGVQSNRARKVWSNNRTKYSTNEDPFPIANRIGDGLAFGRDRLLVLGNGVVPSVAAKAFLYLAYQLLGHLIDG